MPLHFPWNEYRCITCCTAFIISTKVITYMKSVLFSVILSIAGKIYLAIHSCGKLKLCHSIISCGIQKTLYTSFCAGHKGGLLVFVMVSSAELMSLYNHILIKMSSLANTQTRSPANISSLNHTVYMQTITTEVFWNLPMLVIIIILAQ